MMMTYRADIELGDSGSEGTGAVVVPKRAAKTYSGHIEGGRLETQVDDPGQIRVEKGFACRSERR